MTTFFLARHGETIWHADHRYAGNSDVALTRHGLGQAAALGAWAVDAHLDAIVSSPLSRARRSAAPAIETTGLELRIDERLVEIDFGDAEGLTPDEIAERFPAEWTEFSRAPASSPLPRGESGRDGIARALPVFDELVAEFPDGRVLIIGHATLIRLLFCELAGMDPDGYRDLLPVLGNCHLTTIVYPWATESRAEFPDGRVLIVGHATLIRLLFCELAGMDPDGYRDLLPVLGNCHLTTIVYPWATESSAAFHPRIRLLGFDVPPSQAG